MSHIFNSYTSLLQPWRPSLSTLLTFKLDWIETSLAEIWIYRQICALKCSHLVQMFVFSDSALTEEDLKYIVARLLITLLQMLFGVFGIFLAI